MKNPKGFNGKPKKNLMEKNVNRTKRKVFDRTPKYFNENNPKDLNVIKTKRIS